MSDTEFFAAQQIKAGNPLRPYGVSRLVMGFVYLLVGLFVLTRSLPLVRLAVSSGGEALAESLDVFVGIARSAIAILLCIAGVVMVSRGVGGVSRLMVPPRAPRDLEPGELKSALQRRELAAYTLRQEDSYWLLRHWFPNQFPLMTRRMRALIAHGLREVTRFAGVLLAVGLALFGVGALPQDQISMMGTAVPSFPLTFFVLYAIGAGAHIGIAIRAIPSVAPRAEVSEFRASIRGGGDPGHIAHGLEHELGSIRPAEGTPNRSIREGFKMEDGGVADSGQFHGHLIVENQPVVVESLKPAYTLGLLTAGSVLQAIALAWWLGTPSFEQPAAPEPPDIVRVLTWAAALVGGLLLARMGGRMVDGAREVLGTFRFRSVGVVLDVKGNYARSQVRVGKAIHDSIESENLVVRSDSSVSGYIATLLTESPGLLGSRSVVAMVIDDKAKHVENLVTRWLARFEEQAATIVGVDLKDKKLVEMVQANLALDGQRAGTRVLPGGSPSDGARTLPGTTRALERSEDDEGGSSAIKPSR